MSDTLCRAATGDFASYLGGLRDPRVGQDLAAQADPEPSTNGDPAGLLPWHASFIDGSWGAVCDNCAS